MAVKIVKILVISKKKLSMLYIYCCNKVIIYSNEICRNPITRIRVEHLEKKNMSEPDRPTYKQYM